MLSTLQSVPLTYRLAAFADLLGKLRPIPSEWLEGSSPSSRPSESMDCLPCNNYHQLVTAWRKALKWTEGLDHALAVMLASVTSTKSVGDQLWIKVIGPAACGKSTLCEAISVNRDYVLAKSTIRGFHSGYKTDSDGGRDHSLIPLLRGKTLVTKDGDTLLQSPNLGQILSEARDLYDSTSRNYYRNAVGKDYSGVRMTWILCGTNSLRAIDNSELGERFLDCVIMEKIDEQQEDEILWRIVNRATRSLAIETDGKPQSHYEPDLAEAMRLTGGYVGYLRENATCLLSAVRCPDWARHQCIRLGKFVAYMRARPSRKQDESAGRELATRLVSQHVRLSGCLAAVLNRPCIDKDVMARVTKVCMDTARGQTLDIATKLYETPEGLEHVALSFMVGEPEETVRKMLRFLRQIGAVEPFRVRLGKLNSRPRWRLTERMQQLYSDVVPKN